MNLLEIESGLINAVEEIIEALTEYGDDSMELQNMDRDLNYWDNCLKELNNILIKKS